MKKIDAFSTETIFDSSPWTTIWLMNVKWDYEGLAMSDCSRGKAFIAAGAFMRGASHKILDSLFFSGGVCAGKNKLFLFILLMAA